MDALQALVLSEARAKVLTALFSERGRAFYQRELERVTGLPVVAVQRQLRRLSSAGLVAVGTAGGRRVYSADTGSSVYEEIASITVSEIGTVKSRIHRARVAVRNELVAKGWKGSSG